jgi:hypothetical protein
MFFMKNLRFQCVLDFWERRFKKKGKRFKTCPLNGYGAEGGNRWEVVNLLILLVAKNKMCVNIALKRNLSATIFISLQRGVKR